MILLLTKLGRAPPGSPVQLVEATVVEATVVVATVVEVVVPVEEEAMEEAEGKEKHHNFTSTKNKNVHQA